MRTACQLFGESSVKPDLRPSLWAFSGRKVMGICVGGLGAIKKRRGKSGDQPHNLGEKAQPSEQGPALRLK